MGRKAVGSPGWRPRGSWELREKQLAARWMQQCGLVREPSERALESGRRLCLVGWLMQVGRRVGSERAADPWKPPGTQNACARGLRFISQPSPMRFYHVCLRQVIAERHAMWILSWSGDPSGFRYSQLFSTSQHRFHGPKRPRLLACSCPMQGAAHVDWPIALCIAIVQIGLFQPARDPAVSPHPLL
jgi:hypothetical protein